MILVRNNKTKTVSKLQTFAIHAVVLLTVTASAGAQELTRKTAEAEVLRDDRPGSAISATNPPGMRSIAFGGQSASTSHEK